MRGHLVTEHAMKLFSAFFALFCLSLSGCTLIAVTDAAVGTAVGVTKGAVKTTGVVVGAAIPDGDSNEDRGSEDED